MYRSASREVEDAVGIKLTENASTICTNASNALPFPGQAIPIQKPVPSEPPSNSVLYTFVQRQQHMKSPYRKLLIKVIAVVYIMPTTPNTINATSPAFPHRVCATPM